MEWALMACARIRNLALVACIPRITGQVEDIEVMISLEASGTFVVTGMQILPGFSLVELESATIDLRPIAH